jgi:hypothetical protein
VKVATEGSYSPMGTSLSIRIETLVRWPIEN